MAKFYTPPAGGLGSGIIVDENEPTPTSEGQVWFHPSTGRQFISVLQPTNMVMDGNMVAGSRYFNISKAPGGWKNQEDVIPSVIGVNTSAYTGMTVAYISDDGSVRPGNNASAGTGIALRAPNKPDYYEVENGVEYTISCVSRYGTPEISVLMGNWPGMWGPTALVSTENNGTFSASFTANATYATFQIADTANSGLQVGKFRMCKTSDLNSESLQWVPAN